MALSSRSRRSQVTNYWPGFVDALSSLLLVIIFLLSLFMLSQFFLSQEISGRDTAMSRLNAQIAELTELLQLERAGSSDLETTIATLQATLTTTTGEPICATAYSMLAMELVLAILPATRTTKISPSPVSKASSGTTRLSAQLRTMA